LQQIDIQSSAEIIANKPSKIEIIHPASSPLAKLTQTSVVDSTTEIRNRSPTKPGDFKRARNVGDYYAGPFDGANQGGSLTKSQSLGHTLNKRIRLYAANEVSDDTASEGPRILVGLDRIHDAEGTSVETLPSATGSVTAQSLELRADHSDSSLTPLENYSLMGSESDHFEKRGRRSSKLKAQQAQLVNPFRKCTLYTRKISIRS
jgi:hypothetical protein